MNIVVAYADYGKELATSRWRCFIPAKALKGAGHNVALIHISKLVTRDLSGVDVVLAERTLTTGIVKHIRMWGCETAISRR